MLIGCGGSIGPRVEDRADRTSRRLLEAVGEALDQALAGRRVEPHVQPLLHGVRHHAQVVDAVRVVGVVMRIEDAVERFAAHAQELLAQIRRGVDQHRGVPLLAETLDQRAAAAAAVLRVGRIAGAPHGADARHAAGRPAPEDRGAVAHATAVLGCAGRFDLAKQAKEVVRRRRRQLGRRDALHLGQRRRGMRHVGRLVRLAAIGLGRQKRRVGLDQQAIERNRAGDVAQGFRFLEGDDAGERHVQPQLDGAHGELRPAGVAVQDRRERPALGVLVLEDGERVVVGIARVDLERQPGAARRLDVAPEAFRLRLGRAVLVVVVEPRLADGHHLRVLAEADDLVGRDAALLVGVVGVRADRAVDVVVRVGDVEQDGQLADARRDGHHDADARCLGAGDDALAVGDELREVEVAMVVDEHHVGSFAA